MTYANSNRNMQILPKYLSQIENEIDQLEKNFEMEDLARLGQVLKKNDQMIYYSEYFFEPYKLSMIVASVLLIFSPIIKISKLISHVRN